MKLKERAAAIKRDIPAVYLALRHAGTPLCAKILAGITVAYALSPVDLIPDWIPVLGYLDDLLLLPALTAWTIKKIPPAVLAECRRKAEGMWADGKPKKWYFALPFVLFWLLVAGIAVKCIFL